MEILERQAIYNNKSLERALRILIAFNTDRPKLTLAELAQTVAMPRVTVLRLCSTLTQYDFLHLDRETKRYSLGLKLFELGSIVFGSFSLRRIAASHLIKLQSRVGNTVFLGLLQDDDLVYIDKKQDPWMPIRFASHVGSRRPPYFGMLGNLLMAYLTEGRVAELLRKHPLAGSTKRSVTDEAVFRARLAEIRSEGYYIDNEEAIDGITGVAAPVRDFSNEVVASVGVGFITSSEDRRGLGRIVRETLKTASAISKDMGYVEQPGEYEPEAPGRGRKGER